MADPRPRRRAALAATASALALTGLVLLLLAGPAAAVVQQPPQAEALGLDVRVGYADGPVSGTWMPVAVSLSPRRPVAATLEVTTRSADGRLVQQRQIELRAGATAVYRLLAPVGATRVTVREPGSGELDVRVPLPETADRELVVGVLDGAEQPPPVQDPVTDRSATWGAVDRRWLDLGAAALEPLSGLVVDEAILAELDDHAVRTLATAVARGLDLVVAAPDPGPVELRGLLGDDATVTVGEQADPDGLHSLDVPAAAWAVRAADVWPDGDAATTVAVSTAQGRGRVNVVTVAPGVGALAGSPRLWSLLAMGRPPPAAGGGGGGGGGAMMVGDTSATAQLAGLFTSTAGGGASLPWLAVFLVAYIVVVGPVTSTLLARRRRRELTWVAVPAVALVFTLAAVIGVPGAQPLREERAQLHWWLDGAGARLVVAGVRAPTEGVRSVHIDGEDWTVRAMASGRDGATVRTGDGGITVDLSLPSLAFGGVIAERPATEPPPLAIEATVTGDRVVATIRNTGTRPLREVEVRDGAARRPLGELAPGATRDVVFTAGALPSVTPYTAPQPAGARTPADLLGDDLLTPEPGVLWAAGIAGDTTMVAGTRPAPSQDSRLTPMAVDRALVGERPHDVGPLMTTGQGVLRFRVPAALAPDRLADELGDGNVQVWDWRAGTWVPRADLFDDGTGDAGRLLSPTGELYVRAAGGQESSYAQRSVAGGDAAARADGPRGSGDAGESGDAEDGGDAEDSGDARGGGGAEGGA